MFVERNVFHLRIGAAKQALAMWKAYLEKAHFQNNAIRARLLTDITGRGYSLVLELSYPSFAELEPAACSLTKAEGWKEFYAAFIPLCESSERTQYKLEMVF